MSKCISDWCPSVAQRWVAAFSVVAACLVFASDSNAARASSSTGIAPFPSPVRALHIVSRGVTPADMKGLIDQASIARFNVLILGIGWGGSTKLYSMPWVTHSKAWNREQLLDVVNYARGKSIEVVPQFLLLTHQEKFLGTPFPELLYNRQTYDPSNQEVYKLIFQVLDEIIDLLKPRAIHIGHDELFGCPNRPSHWNAGERLLPADLFLSDVQRIHDHLKARSVETWMWGDMLISEDEFPEMNRVFLLGGVPGYGAEMRKKIPKDIVISDGHYKEKGDEFKTIDAFRRDGFRVLGSSFDDSRTMRNFSRYSSLHGAEGMISTLWFYVQQKNKGSVVREIIQSSGEAFNKDFPDARSQ